MTLKIKLVFYCVSCLLFLQANAQEETPFDNYTANTIRLFGFFEKKVVAYKIRNVTICIKYEAYLKEFETLFNRYKKGMKGNEREIKKGHFINPDYIKRYILLDSIYKLITKQIRTSDTIYLNQVTFSEVGMGSIADFSKYIENGTCAIFNNSNKRYYYIRRKKGSWYKGPLHAWGGRRYYLPGTERAFLQATDWIA